MSDVKVMSGDSATRWKTEPPGPFGFDVAVLILKNGGMVCRAGWNGKDMSLRLVKGHARRAEPGRLASEIPKRVEGIDVTPDTFVIDPPGKDDREADTLPFIMMKTAHGHLVPWLASQTDVLASDWQVVSPP